MNFVRNGDTITATATTAGVGEPLLGLENIEGVVLSFKGLKRVYTLDYANARLDLVGTGTWLIIDPEFEELIFRTDHLNDCLRPLSGTLLQIGVETVANGITRYSQGDVLTMPKDTTAQSTVNSLSVNGGRFEWYGGTIYSGDAMGCNAGSTAEIFAGRFVTTSILTNTTAASAMVMRNDGDPNDVISHGVELDSLNPATSAPIVFSRNGLNTFVFTALTGAVQQRTGTWTNALILRGASFSRNAFVFDYNFVGANSSYSLDRVQPAEFFNIDVGTGLRQFSSTNNLNGHISFFQDIKSVISDINGNLIEGAVTYIGTVDHGNRIDDIRPLFQNSRTFSNGEFDSYRVVSDSLGETSVVLLTGRMWVRSSRFEQLDLYSNSGVAGVDDFIVSYFDYNSLPSFTPIIMHSSSEIIDNKNLLPDALIHEHDIDIARSYTLQDTTAKVYDQLKALLFDNYQGEQETTVSKVLEDLDARDLDVVVKGQTTGQATLIEESQTLTGTAQLVGNTLTFSTPQLLASRAKQNRTITLDGVPFIVSSITSDVELEVEAHEGQDIALVNESVIFYQELTLHAPSFQGSIRTTGVVTLEEGAVITIGISDSNGDSTVNITTPAEYDDSIRVYGSLDDALAETNELASGQSIRYQSAEFGGLELFFRAERADGVPAFGSHVISTESGIFDVNIATTSENSALGSILAVTTTLSTMIEQVNGVNTFKNQALPIVTDSRDSILTRIESIKN